MNNQASDYALEVAKYLLKKDSESTNLHDWHSETPLHMAARSSNNGEMIIAVFNARGDPFAKNHNGKTPRDLGNYDKLLKKLSGDIDLKELSSSFILSP